jgi:hypothetical protein
MTDAKFNDLSEKGSEVIRYDQAYKIALYSFGNKVSMEFDTTLNQKLGTLKDMIGLAMQNGAQWHKEEWITDPATQKRKLVKTQVALDTTQIK